MAPNPLIEKTGLRIRRGNYAVANATALGDARLLPMVQDYRRQASGRTAPLDRTDIHRRLPAARYLASRKIDGEFAVLYFDTENLFTLNPGGTVRVGMPWQDEAEILLKESGIRQIVLAGELYAATEGPGRPRVHDVVSIVRQPETDADLERLRFGVFDVIELNGEPSEAPVEETFALVNRLCGEGRRIHPVETEPAGGPGDIDALFRRWVEKEGAEGLVVRSDSAGSFKIKPRHTIDAAVIGFTESSDDRAGMLHDLLLAVVRGDGALQVLCRVGGGFSDDQRRELLSDLKDRVVESEYAEVNSDHVAYQMVRPEWVVEISCLDLISQTTRGGPVNRMVLQFNNPASRYEIIRRMPLVSVISPQFVRLREDKGVNPHDARIDQVADIVTVPMVDRHATELTFARSELVRREVYTKVLKGETMVRKFLLWKSNKESDSNEFPAWVLHYTDFSPNRKVPLARDIRVSNSAAQIETLWVEMKNANVKQGWTKRSRE